LSEAGVLGFEYGYSLARPDCLVLWEAQFGDFVNNAQSIIDLFIASGESKWQRLSGVGLLLPHGWEGLGPEHSSARLERFLQLCAGENIQVCNPTTPVQYFHLLRRQAKVSFRKPLIVMTPKSLLRLPLAVSKIDDFCEGHFHAVLDDPETLQTPKNVIFCSGKIFYQLYKRRSDIENTETAIVRLEQLYPVPDEQIKKTLKQYRGAKNWYWVQEEPENMGGWHFIRPHLNDISGKSLAYIGRKAASSPASGFHSIYQQEQEAIIEQAIGPAAVEKEEAATG
jgi:2-oxoglutarate dehydrogenase E1 component